MTIIHTNYSQSTKGLIEIAQGAVNAYMAARDAAGIAFRNLGGYYDRKPIGADAAAYNTGAEPFKQDKAELEAAYETAKASAETACGFALDAVTAEMDPETREIWAAYVENVRGTMESGVFRLYESKVRLECALNLEGCGIVSLYDESDVQEPHKVVAVIDLDSEEDEMAILRFRSFRKLREARNLSQERLAAAAGLTRGTIGKLESGEQELSSMSGRNLKRIADVLGVTIDDLLSL